MYFQKKQPLTITTQDLLDDDVGEKYFLTKKIVGTILEKGTKNYIVESTIDLPISKTLTAIMAKIVMEYMDKNKKGDCL